MGCFYLKERLHLIAALPREGLAAESAKELIWRIAFNFVRQCLLHEVSFAEDCLHSWIRRYFLVVTKNAGIQCPLPSSTCHFSSLPGRGSECNICEGYPIPD